ncbi:unnamed protein product [Ilex paraguariensis]|uniref:DC1 domain-containing protein n=1 Tax=Ilex paraguariensis TaxID=185542 RepID=A0ABC8RP01_9AQUA
MDQYKHFSHIHGLLFHQMPQGSEIHCSGCNSSGSGCVYVCWQCNFFLHEQCFQANRSMKHPYHPTHSLTLVPYPTYPSNSFFCNSCCQVGTGFSYSCSECEFDLHVHCAYMTQTTPHVSQPYGGSVYETDLIIPGSEEPQMYAVAASPLTPKSQWNNQTETLRLTLESHPNGPYQNQSIPNETPTFNAQYTCMPQTLPSVNAPDFSASPQMPPPAPANQPGNVLYHKTNQMKIQETKNHSHHHSFNPSEEVKEGLKVSSGGEQDPLVANGRPGQSWNHHNLTEEIQHKSHPNHRLVLLPTPPYKDDGAFTCNACFKTGTDLVYHCSICKFDLHVDCATLPETMNREDHEHPLTLLFSSPFKNGEEGKENLIFVCDVCHSTVQESCWVYYCKCKECDYGTHVDCVADEERPERKSEVGSVLAAQMELQRLKIQMQMATQNAQLMASFGQNLANLV